MRKIALLAICCGPSFLQAQNVYDNTFGLSAGLFFPEMDTRLSVDDSATEFGTSISLEGDLKFDKSDQIGRFELFWRPAQKHRLYVEYFAINRDSSGTLDAELEIGDEIFPVDTMVTSHFDTQIFPIIYEYSVYQTANTEIGLGGGVHWIDLDFGIRATNTTLEERSTATGPLPLIGGSFDHRMADKWLLRGSLQAFSASVNNIDGSILSARIGVDYQFNPKFAMGLGYDFFDLDVELEKRGWDGEVSYDYNGLNLRASLIW